MDCAASLVADVLQGFGWAEGTLALVMDLKEAFNAVLPGILLHQLSELDVPARIINFVNFLTTRRILKFSHGDTSPRLLRWGSRREAFFHPYCSTFTLGG